MMRSASLAIGLLAGFVPATLVRAEDFSIELRASTAKGPQGAEAIYPTTKPGPCAILVAAADTSVTVKWIVRNVDKTAIAKDVLVHFFVVKQEKLNQQEVPKLGKYALVESALTMDFKPQDKSDGEITFTAPKTGHYLIRLELQATAAKEKHEPFAALDLDVR